MTYTPGSHDGVVDAVVFVLPGLAPPPTNPPPSSEDGGGGLEAALRAASLKPLPDDFGFEALKGDPRVSDQSIPARPLHLPAPPSACGGGSEPRRARARACVARLLAPRLRLTPHPSPSAIYLSLTNTLHIQLLTWDGVPQPTLASLARGHPLQTVAMACLDQLGVLVRAPPSAPLHHFIFALASPAETSAPAFCGRPRPASCCCSHNLLLTTLPPPLPTPPPFNSTATTTNNKQGALPAAARPKLRALFAAMEARYLANAYHNVAHATDVVQAMASILAAIQLHLGARAAWPRAPGAARAAAAAERWWLRWAAGRAAASGGFGGGAEAAVGRAPAAPLDAIELLAGVVAAAGHDLAHPGRNNAFLVAAKDPQIEIYGAA